jgi:uroporphyrinogen decarboxylase
VILEILQKLKINKTGIWFMRQAGRYLPEYQNLRKKSGTFLETCYNENLITEITLQPIYRFDLDAAIIFSDILVLHDLIGFEVNFIENIGPVLNYNYDFFSLKEEYIDFSNKKIQSIYRGIEQTRKILDKKKALIGFIGAPWTLACYAIEKKSSKDFKKTKIFSYNKEKEFNYLIEIFTYVCKKHILNQIKSGVDVIQIFDSWSNVLDEEDYYKWVFLPFVEISNEIKLHYPNIPIIWFPRASFSHYAKYIKTNEKNFLGNFNCLSVDYSTSLNLLNDILPKNIVIQGNLDPITLVSDDFSIIERKTLEILKELQNRPRIFNLGHGMIPEAKIENIKRLIEVIKDFDRRNYVF